MLIKIKKKISEIMNTKIVKELNYLTKNIIGFTTKTKNSKLLINYF